MGDTVFFQGKPYKKSEIDASIRRAECKRQPEWNDVIEALGELYEQWAKHGTGNPQTLRHLDKLMNTYDSWLG